ncbi:MAG: isochorismatase family protein [Planctomycetota bacterium]|nr:isochorismatase family protein [Planctomycetota bacterium]
MLESRSSLTLIAIMLLVNSSSAEEISLQLRFQKETGKDSGRYHRLTRTESWQPKETAVIVCDVWDLHHCLNAVRRLEEFAPRLNTVLANARERGATIIHSPSDCMPAYVKHPARQRAVAVPRLEPFPQDIEHWCSRIPSEERAAYPIDQSDGGEDDDPAEHAKWAAELKAKGRNPGTPWKRQSDRITIDADHDFISDRGDEVWSILKQRGIKNVILTGVHVNMCVLGRPFGLRQMVRNGFNVVLMRDMTDTMYNPKRWPYVSHYTGNDLIISHIERFVCPTMTSDQFLGGEAFRYKHDTRPHLAIIMAEEGYKTDRTLPAFAAGHLGRYFRVSYVFGSDTERNTLPGLDIVRDADIILVSVRRRTLPTAAMRVLRRFVAAGKPVVGIRTASHAFSVNGKLAEGQAMWPEFDAHVFGGHYHGDHGKPLNSPVSIAAPSHTILAGVPTEPFRQAGSLYKTSPLAKGTTTLLMGRIEGHPAQPVAWTFQRADGGKSFYTSMGHRGDFENPVFLRMLINSLHWAVGLAAPKEPLVRGEDHWSTTSVPHKQTGVTWYRCSVRLPKPWSKHVQLVFGNDDRAWWNGHEIRSNQNAAIDPGWIAVDDANLVVIRTEGGLSKAPKLQSGPRSFSLSGRWQFRRGDDASWSNMPLPAKFGTSTDIVHEPVAINGD